MQNNAHEFLDLYIWWKYSANNHIIQATDHASRQMNMMEVDKVTGRLNSQFKTYALCGAICRMIPSSNWPRPMAPFQGTSDYRGSQM
uniref:40S ribosomal protein S21 n=1 Tax=Ursus americanus TaxID=9643 RepID=A0A452SBI2_URSAM